MDEKDELALMFEDELRDLDNFDDEEYDESFEQLEALGFQLKQELNQRSGVDEESTEDDEWESLMNARKANARFAILEEAVSMHAPSPERKISDFPESDIKNKNTTKGSKAKAPGTLSPTRDSSLSSTVLPYRKQTANLEPEILDLMDTICDAVSAYASLSIREEVAPRSGPVEVDMSHLPSMFTAESEQAVVGDSGISQPTPFDNAVYAERAAILDEAAEDEKKNVQAAIDLLRMAEEKLEREAVEEAAALERDRQQRVLRKQRMAEEMVKAKRKKGATTIQKHVRGRYGRRRAARQKVWVVEEAARSARAEAAEKERKRLEAIAEAQRKEAERRAEEERRQKTAEARRIKAEFELMLDADLEMMAFVNEERYLAEREGAFMSQEEEHGMHIRRDAEGLFLSAQTAIREDWQRRNTEESPEAWAVYEDGEELDAAAEEMRERLQLEQEQQEQQRESEALEPGGGAVEGLAQDAGQAVPQHSDGGGSGRGSAPLKKNPRSALRELYAKRRDGSPDDEGVAFRKKAVSAALAASQKKQEFEVDTLLDAELIHSNLPAVFGQGGATRPHVRSPQEEAEVSGLDRGQAVISPRAKVGMRILSARAPVSAPTAWGLPSDAVILGSDKEIPSIPRPTDFSRVQTGPVCPLAQAIGQWQETYWGQLALVKQAQVDYKADLDRESSFGGGLNGNLPAGEPPELDDDDLDQLASLGVKRDVSHVEALELKVEGLTTTTFLRHHRFVKNLNLNVNRLTTLAGLQYLPNVEVLQVRDNALTDISALACTTKLVDVSLDLNHLSDISALCHHHSLNKLTVRDNQLSTLDSFHGCNFPELSRLELYQNELQSVPEHSLRGLRSLTHLDLGRNKLRHISGAALSQCVHLETLVLSQNGLEAVPAPLHLPHLKYLWLGQNKLCDLQPWIPYQQQPSVNVAEKADDDGSQDGFYSPDDVWRWPLFCPSLERLHLSENLITAIPDASLVLCVNLRSLHLSFNPIATKRALYGVTMCPKLSDLEIQETALTMVNLAREVRESTQEWMMLNLPSLRTYCGNATDALELSGERLRRKKARAEAAAGKYRLSEFHLVSTWSDTDFADEEEEEVLSGLEVPERRGMVLSSLGLHRGVGADFDPSLVQLLDSMCLEEHAVMMREKTRKNFVNAAVRQITQQQQKSGEPDFKDSQIAALYSAGTRTQADIEAAVGRGEAEFAAGLLERHTKALLHWRCTQHPTAVPQPVSLSARVFTEVRANAISSSRRELKGKNSLQKSHIASSILQALVRGFIARSRLSKAIVAAEYHDDELDRIVDGDLPDSSSRARGPDGSGLGDSFDLDAFLETGIDVPELDADFFTHTKHQTPASPPAPEAATEGTSPGDGTGARVKVWDGDVASSRGSAGVTRASSVHTDAQEHKSTDGEDGAGLSGSSDQRDKEEREELADLPTTASGAPMVYGDHRRHRKANRLMLETSAKLSQSPKKGHDLESAASFRFQQSGRDMADKPSVKRSARDASSAGVEEDIGDGQDMFIGSPPLMPSSWADKGKNMPKVTDYHAGMGPLEGSPLNNRGDNAWEGRVGSSTSSRFDDEEAVGEEDDELASLDRPMSAMTDNSAGASPRSRGGDPFGRATSHNPSAPGSAFMLSSGAPSPNQAREQRGGDNVRKQQQADQMAQEWGIRDPKVLALMVKRSKQLKTGGTSGRSLKGATPSASGMAARSMKSSGAFGGKPKSVKGNNKTAGRKGVPPAWARPDGA